MTNFKSKFLFVCLAVMATSFSAITAQENSISVEGIYLEEYNMSSGIKIEKLPNGNYLVSRIFMYDGKIQFVELQTAYVIAPKDATYFFYWHTGRFNDIPGTDGIIVYNLLFDGQTLRGTYFFPEQPTTPPERITYIKQ